MDKIAGTGTIYILWFAVSFLFIAVLLRLSDDIVLR